VDFLIMLKKAESYGANAIARPWLDTCGEPWVEARDLCNRVGAAL
jgi:hypothetical protein